jgi:hypothetical protein
MRKPFHKNSFGSSILFVKVGKNIYICLIIICVTFRRTFELQILGEFGRFEAINGFSIQSWRRLVEGNLC